MKITVKLKRLTKIEGYSYTTLSLHENPLPNTSKATNVIFNGYLDNINVSLLEVMDIEPSSLNFYKQLYPNHKYCLIMNI